MRGKPMNEQDVNRKFDEIIQPKVVNLKVERPPAKFPELRYLWGVTGIVCVVLIVLSATVSTFIEAL
jgi:hypothetical protein